MAFGIGNYATVWEIEDKGKYHSAKISTSKKDKDTGAYTTDFNSYVFFVGEAHGMASELKPKDRIKISSCAVTNKYNKEKQVTYYNFAIFGYEMVNKSTNKQTPEAPPVNDGGGDNDMPF